MSIKRSLDIAVIGVSCRFPGSDDKFSFWKNIISGKDLISRPGKSQLKDLMVNEDLIKNSAYIGACGFLDDIDKFDNEFFKVSSSEAVSMDPQQRLFIQEAYHALEDSGYSSESYKGKIGVYAGSGSPHYLYNLIRTGYLERNSQSKQLLYHLGNEKDFLALKTAYLLNLTGPVLSVNLASATGLAVIVKACEALSNHEADIMLSGATSLIMPNEFGYIYEPGNILSSDGYCRPFDAESTGTVLSSGVGVVALKRLEDAVTDNDYIYSVIKGYAITNDGQHKIGFTAPSIEKQAECIEKALNMADIDFRKLKYIEAHGTGTALGDPIEIAALTMGLKKQTRDEWKCFLGSVKANMGHAQSAAGMAGFIKLILTIKNKKIPPLINFNKPNPRINIHNSPFVINTDPIDWDDDVRVGSVNTLGMGGVNCHVIVQNYENMHLIERSKVVLYPFKKIRHWIEEEVVMQASSKEDNLNIQFFTEKLMNIFKESLKLDQFHVDDSFEMLGVGSLHALDIISNLEKKLDIRLNIDEFMKYNKPILLANYIAEMKYVHSAKATLEELGESNKDRTIFIVHPGNGELYHYKNLADKLKSEFKIIGIHNGIFNDLLNNSLSIESLAAKYIELIKTSQPSGPYILCGWSFGGVVVFEMASQLLKMNEKVEHLVLIDSWAKYSEKLRTADYFYNTYLKKDMGIWSYLLWKRMEALFNYKPSLLGCTVTLLKSSDINDEYIEVNTFDNHWQAYCKKRIRTLLIQGDHETILNFPSVENLAESIIELLKV